MLNDKDLVDFDPKMSHANRDDRTHTRVTPIKMS
jgi:hypothetical protein